jgi:hypothetical protein
MATSPNSDARREQHPVASVKVWPAEVTKAPQPLPSTSTKKSPMNRRGPTKRIGRGTRVVVKPTSQHPGPATGEENSHAESAKEND